MDVVIALPPGFDESVIPTLAVTGGGLDQALGVLVPCLAEVA